MREYQTPPHDVRSAARNLTDDVFARAGSEPDRVVCHRRISGRTWHPVTAARLRDDAMAWAGAMRAAGIHAGDRVAILGRTSYEWTVVDLATWCLGAVSVPLYDTSSAAQAQGILADSGARAVFVQTESRARLVREVMADVPTLEHVWPFDLTMPLPGTDPVPASRSTSADAASIEAERSAVGPGDLATLVFTSGSTAEPQGCRITHGNLLFESSAVAHVFREVIDADDPSALLVLPLAHVLTRVMQVVALREGIRLGYVPEMSRLLDDVHDFAPTILLGVPRVFERLFTQYSQRAAALGSGRRFESATEAAIGYSRALDAGDRPGRVLRTRHRLHDRTVYAGFREALGGRIEAAVCGGAPLGDRLGHFYRGADVPVLEGYGLTETTGAATLTPPGEVRVGWVGRPLPGTGVRVSAEGELLITGPHVFDGYWGAPLAARPAADPSPSWLATGDLGEIDGDGFVRVTGRTHEVIVTAGGKNVVPGPLEDAIRSHPLVGHCLVVGEDRPFVAALITLDETTAPEWAAARGKSRDLRRLSSDTDLRATLQSAVDDANSKVSKAEAVRAFTVLPQTWSDETGELTPSLKLRRAAVAGQHRRDIEAMYRH